MFRYLLIYMACLLFAFSVKAQGISNDTIPKEVLMLDGKPMTEKQIQRYHKQLHKDSIRANFCWPVWSRYVIVYDYVVFAFRS